MKNPKIVLHLGVHKTATTHIQSRFHNSIDLLSNYGINYISLNETRSLITSKLNNTDFDASEIYKMLQDKLACEKLILSDENFLGGTNQPIKNKMYINATKRLKNLLSVFKGSECEVHLTIRNYVDYYISRYFEYLRHFPFLSFEDYYKEINFEESDWLDLIKQIKDAGIQDIKITPFEKVFKNEQAYLDSLLGDDGIRLESADNNPATRRSKISHEGYEVVKFYAKKYAVGSTKKIMQIIDNSHQETESTEFMPFDDSLKSALDEKYKVLVETLKGDE